MFECKKMTRSEAFEFIKNKKIYVNGRSKEIQKKLFAVGYQWGGYWDGEIRYEEAPFLFLNENGIITYSNDMKIFFKDKFIEISAEEIDSIEITDEQRNDSQKEINSNKNHLITVECFVYGKNEGLCASDLNQITNITINPDFILYKTAIKDFELSASEVKINKRYFCIAMIGDYYIYCPESEFNKI